MKNIYNYETFLNEKKYQNVELIAEGIKIPNVLKKISKKIIEKYPEKAKAIAKKYKGLSLEQIIKQIKPKFDSIENKIEQEVKPTNEGLKDVWSAIKKKIGDYQDKIDTVLTTLGLVGLGGGLIITALDATRAIPGIGHYGNSMFSIAIGLIIFGIVTLITNSISNHIAQ